MAVKIKYRIYELVPDFGSNFGNCIILKKTGFYDTTNSFDSEEEALLTLLNDTNSDRRGEDYIIVKQISIT